ncbi:Adhesion G protein-coupled receptor L3 [Nymphon striatum]|nr:Adhesion G protein-coupled receptor L3 [Nymphon striatum]
MEEEATGKSKASDLKSVLAEYQKMSQSVDLKILCGVIAGMMEYFWLAAFMWMFWEGYHLYKMIVKVFNAESLRFKWFILLSYGIPVIPIAISVAIRPDAYDHIAGEICWIKSDAGFRWSFACPIAIIILINTVVFIKAIFTARRALQSKSKESVYLPMLKGSVSLMCVLGITWIFGFLIPVNPVFADIFVILNASQDTELFMFMRYMADFTVNGAKTKSQL